MLRIAAKKKKNTKKTGLTFLSTPLVTIQLSTVAKKGQNNVWFVFWGPTVEEWALWFKTPSWYRWDILYSLPSCSWKAALPGMLGRSSHTSLDREKKRCLKCAAWLIYLIKMQHSKNIPLFNVRQIIFFSPTATKSFSRLPDISLSTLSCRVFLLIFLYSTRAAKRDLSTMGGFFPAVEVVILTLSLLLPLATTDKICKCTHSVEVGECSCGRGCR